MSQKKDQQSQQDPAHDSQGTAPENKSHRRRSRLWRLLKWTLLALLVVFVVLVGLVVWIAGTESGTSFAWHQAERFMPEMIQIDKVEGRLIGPLHVEGLDYKTDDMQASIGTIDFDMALSEILHRRVHVKHLDVDKVDYEVTSEAEQAPEEDEEEQGEPFAMPDEITLPVSVQIDRISINDVSAVTAPDAEAFVVDDLKLEKAQLDDNQWQIKSLTGSGPMFDLDARAHVTPNHDYDANLHARASLDLPDYAPLKARADITGSLQDLKLDADLESPYNLTIQGHVKDALDDLALNIDIAADDIHTDAISDTLPPMAANADIHAEGGVDDLGLDLNADVDSEDYGQAKLDGQVNYTPEQVDIDKLRVGLPKTGGQLTANGQVALSEGNDMDLSVDWSDLGWPLSADPDYTSDKGQLRLTGTMDDYRLSTNLDWRMVGQTRGTLKARGTSDLASFDLKSLDINGAPGHITGNAQTQWDPALDVTAHLEGAHINPGEIVEDIPGNFDFKTDVTAHQEGEAIHADLKRLTADGTLRDNPLNLEARAQYLGDHVKVDRMHLDSGPATAQIQGTFGWLPDSKLDGQWAIHSSDLAKLMPGLAGSLQTEGKVSGLFKAPNLEADLKARDLDAFGNKVERADLDALVDWSGQSQSRVDLAVNDIEAGGQAIDRVTLNLDGTPASHQLALNLDSEIAQADLAMHGALNKNTYEENFTLDKLKAAYDELPPWELASSATGKVSAEAQSIDDACLKSAGASVCLDGSHNAQGSKAHIDLDEFPYDYAEEFFPEGLDVKGAISGEVDANAPTNGAPRVNADFQTTEGLITMANPQGEKVRVLTMQPGHIRAEMANNGLKADVDLPLADDDGIQAHANVAPGDDNMLEHELDGSLKLDLSSLGFITKLSSEVDEFDGRLAGDMDISGTLAKPDIMGKIGLDAPKIVLVTPGLTLTNVNFEAQGEGDSIALDAGAESGDGSLDADGRIDLGEQGQEITLAIKGDHFQMANIPDATAYISPDLNVDVKPDKVDVTGQVVIPEASITPKNIPESGAVAPSSDQVIVTEEDNAAQKAAQAVHADVKVLFGDDVKVDAFGLKAGLGGSLRVVQEPGSDPTGSGEIDVEDGSFRAYGQNLDIQTGKILFSGGPVSSPGLDIKAARYPNEDVTVGVHVRGTPTHPTLELFSDPTMSQSEQLSWLLLGKPLDDTSGDQGSMITQAAMALGTAKGNQMLQGFGDKLGLDDVSLGSGGGAGEDKEGTSLRVGKYLSPNLYVGYGLGLFDQLSTMFMRYTLNSSWSLETSSSSKSTGGDLIWKFER